MPVARRLRALLCLVLFAGTGVGAPLLDAVLFHRHDRAQQTHVESRDNPACHAERCALQLAQKTSGSAPAALAEAPIAVRTPPSEFPLPPSAVRDAAPAGVRNSRAPPLPLA